MKLKRQNEQEKGLKKREAKDTNRIKKKTFKYDTHEKLQEGVKKCNMQ